MQVPRRYVRGVSVLLSLAVLGVLLRSNSSVVPFGKPSWAPSFGEPGPPTSREMPQKHKLPANLTLHLLPHSHSDIGWNLSFQDYYSISVHEVMRRAAVELWKRSDRKFTWGDLAFVDMWMSDEGDKPNRMLPGDDSKLTWRQVLIELMRRKQWEFAGGTYVSPDEGLTTWWAHNAIVDLGHRALARQLNSSVAVAWQIDNFGHMDTMPYLLKNAGYESLILGRMAYRDLYDFAANSDLQFLWQSPRHTQLPADSPLLTHFLSVHYAFPSKSFDFDNRPECNVDQLLRELRQYAMRQVRQYPAHGEILVMMGDDFRYVEAARAFSCMDKLVDTAAKHKDWRDIKIRYSTPSDYFDAIRPFLSKIDRRVRSDPLSNTTTKDANGPTELRLHQGDFFPYQDKPYEQYWSGMLTTRPYLKWLVRDTEQIVQHVESLLAISRIKRYTAARAKASHSNAERWDVLERHMEYARQQVAIGYHHDAITGTCTPGAFRDYVRRLKSASRVSFLIGHYSLLFSSPDLAQSATASSLQQELEEAKAEPRQSRNQHSIAPVGYNTAAQAGEEQEDLGMAKRERTHLIVPPDLCSSGEAKCPGAAVVVTNANSLVKQDQIVRLLLHTLDAVILDNETGQPVDDVEITHQSVGQNNNNDKGTFVVEFLARNIPAFGFKSYAVTASGLKNGWKTLSQIMDTQTRALNEKESTSRSRRKPAYGKGAVVLEKGKTRVQLLVSPDNRIRIGVTHRDQPKERVVWHELRQYFANHKVQASGAYVMHSFMLMYALVFYMFGGALCAGLVLAVLMHCESLSPYRPRFLRRLLLPDLPARLRPSQSMSTKTGENASAGDRLLVSSGYGVKAGPRSPRDADYPTSNSNIPLLVEEDQSQENDAGAKEHHRILADRCDTRPSCKTSVSAFCTPKRIAAASVPAAIGTLVGLVFTYYIEQVADTDMLTSWTVGDNVVLRLILPSFLIGYAVAGSLRWSARRCVLFVYGASLAIALVLFCIPTWQSRPLLTSSAPAEHNQHNAVSRSKLAFNVEHGYLCDSAHIYVNSDTKITYKLCADKEPLLQVTTTLKAAVNREVVAQFEIEQPQVLSEVLGGCSFDMFNGVDVVRRRYSRWTPIPGNYYPSLSHIALPAPRSGNTRSSRSDESTYASALLTLHSRQPMGATCIRVNTLEVLLHRSMSGNDYRGLLEPMVDNIPAAVTHFLDLGLGQVSAKRLGSGSRKASGRASALARNSLINSPPLAFIFPLQASPSSAYYSGIGMAGRSDASLASGDLRFVGIQATDAVGSPYGAAPPPPLLETQNGHRGPDPWPSSNKLSWRATMDVYLRVQALPAEETSVLHNSGAVSVPIHALLNVPTNASSNYTLRAFAVQGGDWTIAPQSNRQRYEVETDRVVLKPGQQALYHFAAM